MKTYILFKRIFTSTIFTLCLFTTLSIKAEVFKIHYLGHSAFVLEFDNGITVVTDYGEPNAWSQWGWDSPIFEIGDLVPDVMTYSHTIHEDHYDPTRIPEGVEHILMKTDSLTISGLTITPIRVCESNINVEDNTAFLFSYKGFKFLHLGDAQAQIKNIHNPDVKNHISEIIPASLDLLFMTIEGPTQFIEAAEVFVDLVKPRRIIPMHYWSEEYLQEFCNYLRLQNDSGKTYQINEVGNAKYVINETDQPQPVEVICLTRSAYYSTTGLGDQDKVKLGFELKQNYPNPFNPATNIKFTIPLQYDGYNSDLNTKLIIYDTLGSEVAELVNRNLKPGSFEVTFDAGNLSSGVYYYSLLRGDFCSTKKMLLLK